MESNIGLAAKYKETKISSIKQNATVRRVDGLVSHQGRVIK